MNRLLIAQAIKTPGVTIIPIEKISIARETRPNMLWWQGTKQVHALVIVSDVGFYALDTDARRMDINDLFEDLPQLRELLNLQAG